MDIDGQDAFNRLLERVEELSDGCGKAQRQISHLESKARRLTDENAALLAGKEREARMVRFVESTAELGAAWQAFVSANPLGSKPKPAPDDDIPF